MATCSGLLAQVWSARNPAVGRKGLSSLPPAFAPYGRWSGVMVVCDRKEGAALEELVRHNQDRGLRERW